MRNVQECLACSSFDLTDQERGCVRDWLDKEARVNYESYHFNCLLGWFILDNYGIPLSPKEAGFD